MARKRNLRIDAARMSASDPAVEGKAFTGTADVVLDVCTRGVYIDTAGDLTCDMLGADDIVTASVLFKNLLAGVVYPFAILKVYDTGTTVAGVLLF